MNNKTPKVSVCAMTYNQKDCIEICLNSLVNQETNFNYEIIIGDDASTDGTSDIVMDFQKKYPDKIRLILQDKNIGSRDNFLAIHNAARGKYIAHIDCDDYAFPNKLQAQADILDSEPKCNIVFHRMKILHDDTNYIRDDMITSSKIWETRFSRSDLLRFGSIACHSSKMYRAKYRNFNLLPNPTIDFTLDILNIQEGFVHYLEDFYGVYRMSAGTERSMPQQTKTYLDQLDYLHELFPEYAIQISENALMMALICLKNTDGNFWQASRIFFNSKSIKPILNLIKDWRTRRCFRLE